jgi:hypothetical protein
LGAGYSLWISAAAEAIEKKQNIHENLNTAAEQTSYSKADFIKSHFFPLYDSSKTLPIVTKPYGLISIVDSDLFPVEAMSYINSLSQLRSRPLQLLRS